VLDLAFAMDCTGKHDKMSDLIYVLLGSWQHILLWISDI
jgi:hypothetical protein